MRSDESGRRGAGRPGRLRPRASLRAGALLLLAAAGCIRLAAKDLDFDTAPYVGHTTTSSTTISWVTREPSVGRVEYGPADGDLAAVRVDPETRKVHEVAIDGLQPNTRYRYRVSPSPRDDASGAFWTAPGPGVPFSFVVLGDTRKGHEVHRAIVRQILALDPAPRFVFNLGDMVSNGDSAPEWQAFFEDVAPLARFVPYYSTLGNHEHDAPVYFELFALPRNSPLPERAYSFDWGSVHFTVIDANKKRRNDARQLEWLTQDLEQARSASFRVVLFHHSGHGTREKRAEDHAKVTRLLDPLLQQGRADLVFNSHDHAYVRARREGLDYVLSGGGGAPLEKIGPPSADTVVQFQVHHYTVVHVTRDRLEVVVIDDSGKTIDSFSREAVPAPGAGGGISR